MFANDAYLLLVAANRVDRLDLATLEVKPLFGEDTRYVNRPRLVGDDFYYHWTDDLPDDWGLDRVQLNAAQRDELLADRGFTFGTLVASEAGLVVASDDGSQLRLVRHSTGC